MKYTSRYIFFNVQRNVKYYGILASRDLEKFSVNARAIVQMKDSYQLNRSIEESKIHSNQNIFCVLFAEEGKGPSSLCLKIMKVEGKKPLSSVCR